MNTQSQRLPTLAALKRQARQLPENFDVIGAPVKHSLALEMVASQYGYRDWNTLHAAACKRPSSPEFQLGHSVCGAYLGQEFTGEIVAISSLAQSERYRLTVEFSEPVDVVTFDSFSALRRRVQCVVDKDGVSAEYTSNGRPQMTLGLLV